MTTPAQLRRAQKLGLGGRLLLTFLWSPLLLLMLLWAVSVDTWKDGWRVGYDTLTLLLWDAWDWVIDPRRTFR